MTFYRDLDFIIAGVQKSGTTTLSNLLTQTSDIFIPTEQEIPFFLETKYQKMGWKKFINYYFSKAKQNQLKGTSTPQYLMFPYSLQEIKNKLPNIKIIIIFRDPIKRLLSQYDMNFRMNVEIRNINEVIKNNFENLDEFRLIKYNSHITKYITSGEYINLTNNLEKLFSKSQLLYINFDDLIKKPQVVLNLVSNFLQIKKFKIKNYKHSMQGGKKKHININHEKYLSFLYKFLFVKFINKISFNFLKKNIEKLMIYIDRINVDTNSKTEIHQIDNKLLFELKEYYKEEYVFLNKILLDNE